MEKRLLLFLLLSFGMMFLYTQFFAPSSKKPNSETPPAGRPADGTGQAAPPNPPAEPPPDELPPEDADPGVRIVPISPEAGEDLVVEGPRVRWTFDSYGGSLREAALKEFAREPGQSLTEPGNWYRALSVRAPDEDPDVRSRSLVLFLLGADGKVAVPVDRAAWEISEETAERVVYRLPVPEAGVLLEKAYTFSEALAGLEGGPYHVDVDVSVTVTDKAVAEKFAGQRLSLRLRGPGGMPVEPFSQAMTVLAAVQTMDRAEPEEISPGKLTDPAKVWPEAEEQGGQRLVEWVGAHSRFFTAVLRVRDPAGTASPQAVFDPLSDFMPVSRRRAGVDVYENGRPFVNLAPGIDFSVPLGAEGSKVTRGFLFFVGPTDRDVLAAPAYESFRSIVDYGFFSPIVKILMFILSAAHSVTGSWGIAIVFLTLLVRIGLFPLSRKSQISMQKYSRQMGRLKPKIEEIKKKHAKNKKKQQEEQMKLMREEGVRMFPAGCLVMFLQLPIFIGLFQALRYAIGMRHSSFLWAADLTAPDRLGGPYNTAGIPLLPDPFFLNLLPILMAITWFLSAAMAPKAADPQQAQQQKMMKWFPLLFAVFLYNYPAGLALYMVVSATWSIFEAKVVRKHILQSEPAPAVVAAPEFRKGK